MRESDHLTDEYRDRVLKSAGNDLIEEKKVNGKLASGTYSKVLLSLKAMISQIVQRMWLMIDCGEAVVYIEN